MEKLIRELFYAPEGARAEVRARPRLAGMLAPSLALAAFSALLASYSPFEELAPFGTACIMAAWYAGLDPCFSAVGAAVGYALGGYPAYAVLSVVMGAGIFAVNTQGSIMRLYRLLLAFAAECVLLVPLSAAFRMRFVFQIGSAAVSASAAVVIGCGLRSLEGLLGGRNASDTELLTVSASAGLAALAMRNFNVLGVSPALIFAGICALFAAYRLGAAAVACAVTVGAGRVLACGGDMHFIAVLSAMTLVGASLRGLGKWACLAGFMLTGVCFAVFVKGLYLFNYAELAAVGLVFALTPQKLYMPDSVREGLRSGLRPAPAYSRLQFNVASLSEVLSELARVCGGRDGRLIGCISDTLRRSLSQGKRAKAEYRAEYGKASKTREGSGSSGDSAIMRAFDGKLLLALSDGMGSGREAANESRSALALLSDLLSVGFDPEEAAGFANDLLTRRGGGDMYATLDVMLIDLTDGTASLSKHGAPPGYVVRGSELMTLYAEGLPVGIIENARSASGKLRLRAGDTVIMMTDGAADALGSGLSKAISDNVLGFGDPELAARSLLEEAAKHGARDDMTVIVARFDREPTQKSR